MPQPPLDWLQRAADRQLEVNEINVRAALRYRAYVQVLDARGNVMQPPGSLGACAGFRVTERGHALLEAANQKRQLPFDKNDPPVEVQLWINAFHRCLRNCPKGLALAHSNDQLHVLVIDNDGNLVDDEAHRVASMYALWCGA